jgi:dienelactone hydrolase
MKTFIALFMLFICTTLSFAKEGFVTYVVDGKTYEGYYTTPSDEAPLVFIIHDWDGLNEYEMTRAKMLNALGYGAFAIDLFGQGVKPVPLEEKKALTNALYNDRAKMRKLLDAGYQAAKKEGANVSNAIGIGYCFGGAALLEMARMGTPLKGFAVFHGGLATPAGEDYMKTKGFILVLHGSADESVSLDEFAGLAKELEKTGLKHEMITYSGAPHAFTVFGTDRYREDADKKSWRRLVEFLGEMLSK